MFHRSCQGVNGKTKVASNLAWQGVEPNMLKKGPPMLRVTCINAPAIMIMLKTKGMAMGEELSDEDVAPVQVEGGEIEMVEHFSYLGLVLSCDGEVMKDVKSRIAKASKAFGCLRIPIFNNPYTNKESSVQGYSGVSTDVWSRDLGT